MDNLLLKLISAILGLIAEIAMTFLKIVLGKTDGVLTLPYVQMGIEFAMIISGIMLLFSLMKEVLFKLGGLEGNFEDLTGGEILVKFMSSALLIPLLPKAFTIIYDIGFVIINALLKVVSKQITFNYGGIVNNDINSALDFLKSTEFIVKTVTEAGGTAIIVFIMVFVISTMLAVTLIFILVELAISVIMSPIAGASLIKNADKLNATLENFIAMLCLFGLQIFGIFWAVSLLTNQVADIQDSETFIWNAILSVAVLSVSSAPSVVAVLAKGRQTSGSGGIQKMFYTMTMVNSLKGIIKK